jgi:RNA polymerase primary sigma factor
MKEKRLSLKIILGCRVQRRTLEDIGSDFDLTKERVRQIKEKALRKLT